MLELWGSSQGGTQGIWKPEIKSCFGRKQRIWEGKRIDNQALQLLLLEEQFLSIAISSQFRER